MRVISQGRDYSVNFDSTPFWCQNQCIYAKVGNENIVFAVYKTPERTKEVFREMHDAFYPLLPEIPESAADMSADDIITLLNKQATTIPAVLTIPHEESCEYVFSPYTIYYMPEV